MVEVVVRFLNRDVMNFHPAIPWGIVGVWILLLVSFVSSIRSQEKMTLGAKWTWFLLVFLLPILGLFLYSVRCLFKGDWSFLKPLMQSKSQAVRSVTNTGKTRMTP